MKIVKLHLKPEESCNIYILGEEGEECFIIDPGSDENGSLSKYISKHHSGIFGILLTHGHIDHIDGLKNMERSIPLYLDGGEIEFLNDPRLNLSLMFEGRSKTFDGFVTNPLADGDEIKFEGETIKVISTPFHTSGSVCYYLAQENVLFSGDTLFHLSIGRSDLPTGDASLARESLKKIITLPPETKILPGHGENSVLEKELLYNSHLLALFGRY